MSDDTEATSFIVRQPPFEGTLGELAYALRTGSVAPGRIDLLELVRDYLRYFDSIAGQNLELASVALPGVAQVIELKLRLLLPRARVETPGDDEEDLDAALQAVALLEDLEEAIDFLRERRDARRIMLPARTPRPEYPRRERPVKTGIDDLAQLASRYRSSGYFELVVDRLTVGGAIEKLLAALRRWGRALLHEAPERPSWAELTVYFASMLELVREGRVRAVQEAPYGEIELQLIEAETAEVA